MPGKKLGLVSTTINDETGYLPFDRLAADSEFDEVFFCIAADRKTPAFDTSRFECPVHFLSPREQEIYRCSPEIGWNRIMRRNTSLLRCIAEQPDYILMIDDDNLPPDDYFSQWLRVLTTDARQKIIAPPSDRPVWFNYLRSSDAPVEIYPRGFPITERGQQSGEIIALGTQGVCADDIWLFQGISLGDPDIDAITRITVAPELTTIGESDYVLRDIWSPYNTQNTAFAQALFPLAFVWPKCGRYDDIFASFSWQQFTFSHGRYVHIGQPLNVQKRRQRDLLADLAAESEGYQVCNDVFDAVRSLQADDAIGFIEALLDLDGPEVLTRQQRFMEAFRRDLESVLA